MNIYVGITDDNWYNFLQNIQPHEVNFWQPKGSRNFKAIKEGELFLFKLHSPNNYIVGGGIFIRQFFLPISLVWDAFGLKNGTPTQDDFEKSIYQYRGTSRRIEPDPEIGCLILSSPFFFEKSDWLPMPENWPKSGIQTGKTYNTDTIEGKQLYENIQTRLNSNLLVSEEAIRYGKSQIIVPRLGQGSFRIIVTEAYNRRCAVTGEKTLPVLNASHIKPYSKEGPHLIHNGLLLRQDVHTLFDRGYITITEDHIIEVSKKIKEDYGNGKECYAFHGKELVNLPLKKADQPAKEFLQWHNENIYVS